MIQSLNTLEERLLMWTTWHLFGWGSPSLKMLGLRPTLEWVNTGRSIDAAVID